MLLKLYTQEEEGFICFEGDEKLTRLGLIIPSSNTIMESEFWKMIPEGFSVHSSRLRLKEVTVEELELMEKRVEDAALKLADAEIDIIGYGCTSGSLFKGLGHDKSIEKRIERVAGLPAIATAGAVVSALRTLNMKEVCVATPYTDQINNLEEKFLSLSGFRVVDLKGLGMKKNLEIGRLSSEVAYKLVMGLEYAGADGVFVSCTNLATADIIEKLERVTQRRVVSSNTATLWAMLKKCQVSAEIKGFGSLLERI